MLTKFRVYYCYKRDSKREKKKRKRTRGEKKIIIIKENGSWVCCARIYSNIYKCLSTSVCRFFFPVFGALVLSIHVFFFVVRGTGVGRVVLFCCPQTCRP